MVHKCCVCHKKQPIFNYQGLKAEYCADCKSDEMVDVKNKKCCVCHSKQPYYNNIGLKAKYCGDCKSDGMVDVRHKKCIHNKRECWSCNPIDLLQHVCRSRIREFFFKEKDPDSYLGASYDVIYQHIKSQLTPDMTYDNYGKGSDQWSIDHIIPILYNNPTEAEIKARFHYSNLQPIFFNSQKKNSLRQEDIDVLVNKWDILTNELQYQISGIETVYKPQKIKLQLKIKKI